MPVPQHSGQAQEAAPVWFAEMAGLCLLYCVRPPVAEGWVPSAAHQRHSAQGSQRERLQNALRRWLASACCIVHNRPLTGWRGSHQQHISATALRADARSGSRTTCRDNWPLCAVLCTGPCCHRVGPVSSTSAPALRAGAGSGSSPVCASPCTPAAPHHLLPTGTSTRQTQVDQCRAAYR